jgi:histidinol-phosphatase
MSWDEELRFANEVADAADAISTSLFLSATLEVREKDDLTPVTEADTSIEAMVRLAVERSFPGDAVLGEEEGLAGSGDRVWILDPIDGTKNFAGGVPIWGTLLALAVEGRPVVGVVSMPALGERYAAAAGSGATLNGDAIRVSSVGSMERAMLVSTGFKDWLTGPLAAPFARLVQESRRTRGFGDCWGHMLVARGAAEMMLEPSLRVWDYSAVQVVVEEAGGRMTALDGSPLADHSSALSVNAALFEEVSGRFAGLLGNGPLPPGE